MIALASVITIYDVTFMQQLVLVTGNYDVIEQRRHFEEHEMHGGGGGILFGGEPQLENGLMDFADFLHAH